MITINKKIGIDSLTNSYKIFIDTSSLMNPNAEVFLLDKVRYFLAKNLNKIIVPVKVLQELQGLAKNNDPVIKFNARKAYSIFLKLESLGLCLKMGEKGDGYVDNLFQVLFTKFRTQYKLCLMTQDVSLALDILDLNKSRSSEYNKTGKRMIKGIKVIKLIENGLFEEFYTQKKKPYIPRKIEYKKKSPTKPFKKSIKNIDINKSRILATSLSPTTNDFVLTQQGRKIQLLDKIASGGEGFIYSISDKEVCKVYKKEKVDDIRIQKLKLMTSNVITIRGICWPKSVIYNLNKEPVGYIMNKAEGFELQRTVFIPPLLINRFPTWKKIDLVNVCIDILHKISKLHEYNILMGDINPMNILVSENNRTYLVDTDSYQVEQYPCPVGQVNFTAPEIQGKDFKTFLRTTESENFAIATLLFMILLPGKPPYSHKGGTTPAANIKKRKFTYPFSYINEEGVAVRDFNYEAPVGHWRLIWSNFPHILQEKFYNTFKNGKRYSINEWITTLKKFKWFINKGFTSNEIFPKEFKKVDDSIKQKFKERIK